MLAFVAVAAWERFERADEKVQDEAIALASLYRLAKGLPQPLQHDFQQAVRAYTEHAINIEWSEMAHYVHGKMDNPIGALGLWALISSYNPPDARQNLLVEKSWQRPPGREQCCFKRCPGSPFPIDSSLRYLLIVR